MNQTDMLAQAEAGHERASALPATSSSEEQGESTVAYLVTGAIFGIITVFVWLDGLHALEHWLGR